MSILAKRLVRLRIPALFSGIALLAIALTAPVETLASVTSVTPNTWNVIGLDSNSPAFGPYRFPVGAKICSNTGETGLPVTFSWQAGGSDNGTYINLRPGSSSAINLDIPAGGCTDAYFEVEINRTSLAFDQTRRFRITAGALSTPTPREIKVERLVSQSRNAITNLEYGTSLASLTSVSNGGSFDLTVGNTYYIRMSGFTATQGYEQLESFVNFPNTIFQILSVTSTYSADTSPIVNSPSDKLYADACGWDNDLTSPSYLSCLLDGKAGGTVQVTYQVKILSVGSGRETLNSLIHDFSGSSFHYNADYSTSARFVNLVDPTAVTISKNFAPDPVISNGTSKLTFTLNNLTNGGAVTGVSFTDTFPTTPGAMTIASPLTTTNSCGGTLLDSSGGGLGTGDPGISLNGGSIPAFSSCSITVNVTAPVQGSYTNSTGNLFVGAIDTGNHATDTLAIDDAAIPPPPAPPSSCSSPVQIARWEMASLAVTSKASDVTTATASSSGGTFAIDTTQGNPVNSWAGSGWSTVSPATATPYYLFSLDTRNYGGVAIALDYYMASGDWSNPADNYMIIDSQANGGGFNNILNANVGKGSWTAIPLTGGYTAFSTGTTSTDFKIRAYGAKSGKNLYIDNVTFTGCPRPVPPTISKAFSLNPVALSGTSTLTFTVTNPNAGNALSGIAFTDTLPEGMTVTSGTSSVCGGTLTRTAPNQLSFAGGTLAAAGTCTIPATVTATTTGTLTNVSGFVTSTESGANTGASGSATAQLVVLAPPAITKSFGSNPIYTSAFGGVSTLTFTLTNPNAGNALAGVAFTDNYPGGLVNASTPNASTTCTGGTVTAAAGGGSVALSGVALAAGGSCSVSVNVTSASAGLYDNSVTVSHLLNAATWNGNTSATSLLVETPSPAISLLKQVAPAGAGPWSSYLAVATGGDVYYRFTVENLGDVNLSSVNISDPALVASGLNPASCSWTDGDGGSLTAPFALPVADADNGHIATCVLGPLAALAGPHPNIATASGSFGAATVTDTSMATYATTALTLDKTADRAYYLAAGEVITYSYAINNAGADLIGPLTVTVTDNKIATVACPALATIGNFDNDFNTGETLACTATYTVTASDLIAEQVTNIARANIRDGIALNINTPQDTLTVLAGPDLVVTKTNNVGGTAATNVPFTWTLTAKNTTSLGLTSTFANGQRLLVDKLPGGPTYSAPAVATNTSGTTGTISCAIAADTLTCTATGAVVIPPDGGFTIAVNTTSAATGSLVNPTGGLCRIDPDGIVAEINETNNDCTDTVTVSTPAITLFKNATPNYFLAAGNTLDYSYRVRNTGLTPVAGPVTIADDKTSDESCPDVTTAVIAATGLPGNGDANLDPGEQLTCTSSYTVQASDVTAGQVTNVAIATVGTGGTAVNSPQVSLAVPIGPDLGVSKASDLASVASPGIPFNWILTVTNAAAAGYPAIFTAGQLLLTDDLPVGPTYSVPATAAATGNSIGTITCAIADNTLSCLAAGDVSIPPGSGFTVAVATTPAIGGALANPRDPGICRVDPAAQLPEISDSNNDCADTVAVGLPLLTVVKSADRATAAPGDLINYTLVLGNSGPVIARNVKIVDAMGRLTALRIDPYGNGTPFDFTAETSGVTIQTIEYSDDTDPSDGITYGYIPTDPDGDGVDDNITRWRITMDGDMQPAPSQLTLRYQALVK